jgi:hypothetical protein
VSDINDYSDWQPDKRKIKLADLPIAERELGQEEMRAVEGGSLVESDAQTEERTATGIIGKVNSLLGKLGLKSPF